MAQRQSSIITMLAMETSTADPDANVSMFWTKWTGIGVALLCWRGAHLSHWLTSSSTSFDLIAMYAICMHCTMDKSMLTPE
jgi:hypothetical protein